VIRTAWAYLVSSLATVYFGTEVMLRTLLRLPGIERSCRRIARQWSACVLWGSGVRVEMEGVEHLRQEGGQVIVANHASWFDVWALCANLPVPFHFVAKQELKKIPFFGQAWVACGHISIDRGDRTAAVGSLNRTAGEMGSSRSNIIIFPEGTRTSDGSLQRFKKGAFVLALQAGVPIVPAAIVGSRPVMPKGSLKIQSGTVRIRFGPPIEVEGLTMRDRDDLLARTREAVESLLLQPPQP
jgi:1-acyl-sn-glycerol-3-phosphate acyltransferase